MANLNEVKATNKHFVLDLVRRKGAISRADLSRLSGLTRATVSALTGELIEEKFLKELMVGDSKKGRGGRKPVLLSLDGESKLFAGIDLHWDYFQIAVSNILGEIVTEDVYRFDRRLSPEEYFGVLSERANRVFHKDDFSGRISAIGVSLYGVVDTKNGVLKFPSHMHWPQIELERYIVDFPAPVFWESRSAASLIAETWFHEELYPRDGLIVFVNVIEGIGGAVMLNGEILKNDGISTGEIGHTTVDINGNTCTCGRRGCLEAYVSDKKLVESYVDQLDKLSLPTKSIRDMAIKIAQMASRGEEPAIKAVQQMARNLSVGIGNVINFLSPNYVVIGGFITEAWSVVEPIIREEVTRQALPGLFISTEVVKNHYGSRSGLIGALAVAIREKMRQVGSIESNSLEHRGV